MISTCPKCNRELEEFSVSCEQCGWSVVHQQSVRPSSSPAPNQDQWLGRIFKLSVDAIEQERFSEALDDLNRSIGIAPSHRLAECYSLRGYCRLKSKEFRLAEKDCTEAIVLNCRNAQTYMWRAAARGEQDNWKDAFDDIDEACRVAGPKRDFFLELMNGYGQTAMAHFQTLIDGGHGTADVYFERGWVFFKMGSREKARADFQKALIMTPGHGWASTGLAHLMLKDGRLLSRLRRSLRRSKRNEDNDKIDALVAEAIRLCNFGAAETSQTECQWAALTVRARLFHSMGKPSHAYRDLKKLTRRAANDLEKIIHCCQLRYELGDHMSAVTQLTELLDGRPAHQRALFLRGKCYFKVRNYALAVADLENLLRLNSSDLDARIELANVFLATRQIDKASLEFEKVIRDNQASFEAHLGLSKVFLAKERLDLALTECNKAIAVDSSQSEAFATKAQLYLKLCDFSRSIDAYARAIKIASNSATKANYLYLRGAVYYETAQFDLALKDFRRSCRLRPNHAGAWVWQAAACSRLECWSAANESLAKAMTIRPETASQYRQLGRRIAKKAVKYFSAEIKKGNDGRQNYRDRAVANQFLHMYASAIEDLTTALDRDPGNADLLVRRGQVYASTGDYSSANEDFGKAIKIDRRNHSARYSRAQCRSMVGDFVGARRDIQKAIRISAIHPQYHKLLANVFVQLQQHGEVINCLNRATMLDSTDAASYRMRGDSHVATKNWIAAINDYTRSMELDRSQTDLLIDRGSAHARAEKPDLAIVDYELALTRNPLFVKAWSGRANCLMMLGQHDYALVWLTKALHRFPKPRDLCELLFARGKVFYSAGRFSEAVADFTSAARTMSSDEKVVAAVKYARAIALVQLKHIDSARRDFRIVLDLDENNLAAQVALQWLADPRSIAMPAFLKKPKASKKPVRPPVVRSPVKLITPTKDWHAEKPFNCWILRTLDKTEYGPVERSIVNQWIEEGRIDFGMKMLRADWAKFKRVERIFRELQPGGADAQTGAVNANQMQSESHS